MTNIDANISETVKNTSSPIKFNLAATVVLAFMIIGISSISVLPELIRIILVSAFSMLFIFIVIWTVVKAPKQPINYVFNPEAHIALQERLSDSEMKEYYYNTVRSKQNVKAPIELESRKESEEKEE